MWYFRSPEVVYGEDALSHLATLRGRRAVIVTDPMMEQLGFVEQVGAQLAAAGFEYRVFNQVEPEPSLQTVQRGAEYLADFGPDWIVGLGGGSALDAAKAMWILYEHPGLKPEAINPLEELPLRQKARMVAIPTTSGTGSEATWAVVLTDLEEKRKIGTGNPACMPDVAIVDPVFALKMPPRLTADTGLDALTHAVEGYTSNWHNEFADGLCLTAIKLIFTYLPRAYADGNDAEAREKMHNAATLAGLGFINSLHSLAHCFGHSLGAIYRLPHGRAVALFLPYTIQFNANYEEYSGRYGHIARFIGLPAGDRQEETARLVEAIRRLQTEVGQPLSIRQALPNLSPASFEDDLDRLVANAESDPGIVASERPITTDETFKIFQYAYQGKHIDF
ncbi:MAG: iron-containing alcohol dehydrogenase [Anaerolineae bacterium]